MTGDPPYSRSPLEGLKTRLPAVPLRARVVMLVSVTIALFAAILISYSDESLIVPIIAVGIVIGLVLAVIATFRNRV